MAAWIAVENESGTYSGRVHHHNGYYAGDFAAQRQVRPAAWHVPVTAFETEQR